jgi:hypothetical protein
MVLPISEAMSSNRAACELMPRLIKAWRSTLISINTTTTRNIPTSTAKNAGARGR